MRSSCGSAAQLHVLLADEHCLHIKTLRLYKTDVKWQMSCLDMLLMWFKGWSEGESALWHINSTGFMNPFAHFLKIKHSNVQLISFSLQRSWAALTPFWMSVPSTVTVKTTGVRSEVVPTNQGNKFSLVSSLCFILLPDDSFRCSLKTCKTSRWSAVPDQVGALGKILAGPPLASQSISQ